MAFDDIDPDEIEFFDQQEEDQEEPVGGQDEPENQGEGDPTIDEEDQGEPKEDEPKEEPEEPSKETEEGVQADYGWLSTETDGRVTSKEELQSLLAENDQLKADAQKPKEPEFQNKAAEQVFKFAQKFSDKDQMSAASRFIQVMNIDTTEANGKDVLFEKFLVDNPSLTRDKGMEIFEGMHEEKYPEDLLEEKPHLKFKFDQEVESARTELQNLQKEFNEGLEQTNTSDQQEQVTEQTEQFKNTIQSELPKFEGMKFSINIGEDDAVSIGDFDPKNTNQNLSIDLPKEDAERFREALLNPSKFWQEKFSNPDGSVNTQAYMQTMFNNMFGDTIQSKIASEVGKRAKIHLLGKFKGIDPEARERGKQQPAGEDDLAAQIDKAMKEQDFQRT